MKPMSKKPLNKTVKNQGMQWGKKLVHGSSFLFLIAIAAEFFPSSYEFLMIKGLLIATALAFLFISLYLCSRSVFAFNFCKLCKANQYNHTYIADLLHYPTDLLQRALKIINLKIEADKPYSNSFIETLPVLLAITAVMIAGEVVSPVYREVWIISICAMTIAIVYGYIFHKKNVLTEYIHRKELLTMALDYKERRITLPLFHTVPNISALERNYLKIKSFF
jgi:hypothetical protein